MIFPQLLPFFSFPFFMLANQYHMVLDFLLWFLLPSINAFFVIAISKESTKMFDLSWLIFKGQLKANKLSSAKTGKPKLLWAKSKAAEKLWHSFLQNQFLVWFAVAHIFYKMVLSFFNAIMYVTKTLKNGPSWASYPFKGNNKVLHPKYYNTWKTMLFTVIWADKNGLVSVRLACTSSILDFNPEFSIQSRIPWKVKEIIWDSNLDLTFYRSQNPFPQILNHYYCKL